MPGIVLLAGPGRSSWVVARILSSSNPDVTILVEQPPSRRKMLRARVRRLGLMTVAGQVLFIALARLIERRTTARCSQILAEAGLDDRPLEGDRFTEVDNFNDEAVAERIRQAKPDLVVVNGTRILSRRLLASTEAPFINMHAGITPRYRGVHGGYWARARGDLEHCGVTVHLVDPGVDTGGVLYQARIAPTGADNYFTYPMLQLAAGVPLLLQAVEDALLNRLSPLASEGESRQWYHPTLWGYIGTGLRSGIW